MKHLKKIAALVLAVVMAAAVAIGIGVIFAVRNINVTLLSYTSGEDEAKNEISSLKQNVAEKCKGRVISFVSEEDVVSALDENYTLEVFEKIFPCTLNLTLKQRREVFAVEDGERFAMYDDSGSLMRYAEANINSTDDSPNVLVTGAETVGDMVTTAEICKIFQDSSNFAALRSVVESVALYKSKTNISTDKDKITFYLRSGLKIEVQDYGNAVNEKISKAYKLFCSLSGEQKLSGKIYALSDMNGETVTTYDAND